MHLSLVVCTAGRSSELIDLFASLVRQKRTDFEVILVDQNSDRRLVPIVAQFAHEFPLKHLRLAGTGASLARNGGLDHATGDLIGFPDDDCQYLPSYLDTVHQIFAENPTIGAITGFPTIDPAKELGSAWPVGQVDLDCVNVLNACQEFTVFVRRDNLGDLRYNERLGVGAKTLWGAEEGPDLVIRLMQTGSRVVHFPLLFTYHPNKLAVFSRSTRQRAASYSRGRGCLLRLHRFPIKVKVRTVFRPWMACILYLFTVQPRRFAYYLAVTLGLLRGLFMSRAELREVRSSPSSPPSPLQPISLPSLSPEPLVSVLIANYNYARFLPAALDALLGQTYNNWHAVVCDDGSTDDSLLVLEEYCKLDQRIQVLRNSNGGQNSAYNSCYQQALGEIICFLDADDAFQPRKLQHVVDTFLHNPDAGICNHFCQVIDAAGEPQDVSMFSFLDSGWMAEKALARGACVYVPTTSCMALRREIGDMLFPVPSRQERDLDGYLGMTAQFLSPVCVIHERLASYRIHGANMGGLSDPTTKRLQYEIRLIQQRTSNVKEFVKEKFGDTIAGRLVLQDNPQYLQAALKLLAIGGGDQRLQSATVLISRHPSKKWKAIWYLIFALPEALTRRTVIWMHRSYRAKALAHQLLGRTRLIAT